MKIGLAYGTHTVATMEDLPQQYPADEFKSPFRSTIPHLLWWRQPAQRLAELLTNFGESLPQLAQLNFEHQLEPVSGRGKPSHTDLMISWERGAIGIEAKWTEPEYQTVEEWLGSLPSGNRLKVLSGWLALLDRCSSRSIGREDVGRLAYQLVHRAASVCAQEKPVKYLLYEVFESPNKNHSYYLSQLQELRRLTMPEKLHICLVEIPVTRTETFDSLVKKSMNWKDLVTGALRENNPKGNGLLVFGPTKFTIIE